MAEIYSDPRMEERGRSFGGRTGALGKSAKEIDADLQAFKASVEARLAALEAPKPVEPAPSDDSGTVQ